MTQTSSRKLCRLAVAGAFSGCALFLANSGVRAACAPAGPYNGAANIIVCAPGVGETIDTLGGSDSVTLDSGTLGSLSMGTGNDVFVLNGGVVTTVNQDAASPATQGSDSATISGGTVSGTLSQGGGSDTYGHSGAGSVAILDQGSGNDTASVGLGATIGLLLQGSGTDQLTITGGSITSIDQGSFGDTLSMSGGLIGAILTGTGDDLTEITGGIVAGAIDQGDGSDTFVMSAGQIAALMQSADFDYAFISGGTITGAFSEGDYAEIAGGSIGSVDLTSGNNELYVWGGAAILGPVNAESGVDSYFLFGGGIGGLVTTGSNADTIVIGGTPTTFNGTPFAGTFGATSLTGSIVMEGGNDSLTMVAGTVGGDIYMDGGLGNANALGADGFDDIVLLLGGTVGGSILTDSAADAQAGRDSVTINGAAVGGSVDTGDDNDLVQLLSGSIAGSVLTGAGQDQLLLQGGALTGDALGGGDDDVVLLQGAIVTGRIGGGNGADQIELLNGRVAAVEGNDGDDLIVWSSPGATVGSSGANNGMIEGGDGSDIVAINNPTIDLSQMTLDGGDDTATADGFIDALALNAGWSGTLTGARTRNFEVIYIDGGTVASADGRIATSQDTGTDSRLSTLAGFDVPYGIVVDNGGTLAATNALSVTGNVTLRRGTLAASGVGANNVSISGDLANPKGSVIDLSGDRPAAGDMLRIGRTYTGGGTLMLDAALDQSARADVLVIKGSVGTATSATVIRLTDVGSGAGWSTGTGPGRGIRLVDVSASKQTSAGQFVLAGGPIRVNAFTYSLNLESNGIWYLQSSTRPIVAPTVSVPNVLESIALTFAGTLHERVGADGLGRQDGRAGWVRLLGQQGGESLATDAFGMLETATKLAGLQGGLDLIGWRLADGGTIQTGLSLGYAEAAATSENNGVGGRTQFAGALAGLYLTHHAASGWYADLGAYGSFVDIDATAGVDEVSTSSETLLASLEVGQAMPLGVAGLAIEPQAQLLYLNRGIDDVSMAGATWHFDTKSSLIGRAGLRLLATAPSDDAAQPSATAYVKLDVWNVLAGGGTDMRIGALPVAIAGRDLWADAGLGFAVEAARGLTLFADGDAEFELGGLDYHALTGKVGLRWTW